MADKEVLYETIEGGVALVTLSRPTRGNAFTARMLVELFAALERAALDAAVRVIVVTGSGQKAFSVRAWLTRTLLGLGLIEHVALQVGFDMDGLARVSKSTVSRDELRSLPLVAPERQITWP